MQKIIIKSVNRKTTISKALIKKAAKIAYATPEKMVAKNTASKKVGKAA